MKETVSIYKHNGLKVMLVTDEHNLSDVIEAFESVLKCSGYCFTGHLDLVEDA